jgi:hypothetical protein
MWNLQPLPPPDPLDALEVDDPAGFPQQRRDPAIAIATVAGGKRDDVGINAVSSSGCFVNQTLEALLNDVEKRVEGNEGGICAVIHDRPSIRRGKRQAAPSIREVMHVLLNGR